MKVAATPARTAAKRGDLDHRRFLVDADHFAAKGREADRQNA
jgi:hypothetical protein